LEDLDRRVELLDHLGHDVSVTAVTVPLDAEHGDT
jgi:hypothetical protein